MIARRLPGFRFVAQPPPRRDPLPRMDIAAFVGCAAAGPLDCPVPVEDPARFAAIFGRDAPLAWDVGRGEQVFAYLAPAVRAFFRNGGQRCWVVRVADRATAAAARFRLPGILRVDVAASGKLSLSQATAWARSEGSWADGVRVGAAFTAERVGVQGVQAEPVTGELTLAMAGALRVGDVLRLRYEDAGLTAFMAVERISTVAVQAPPNNERHLAERYHGRAIWFAPPRPALAGPLAPGVTATWEDEVGTQTASVLEVHSSGEDAVELTLGVPLAQAPAPGVMLRLDLAPHPVWLMVREASAVPAGSPVDAAVRVVGAGLAWLEPLPALPAELPRGERLSLELHAATGAADPLRLANLDLAAPAPRYWAALPADAELFDLAESDRRDAYAGLWREAADPRFPLAGIDLGSAQQPGQAGPLFTFPLGLTALPEHLVRAETGPQPALVRDGLAEFRRDLFLDAALADSLTAEVMARADDIRYLAPATRPLRGIHAVLALDEVTLVAVPDAVHRPWQPAPEADLPPAAVLEPLPRPEWWHFQGCNPDVRRTAEPAWGHFLDCAIRIITPPELLAESVDAHGTLTLAWTPGEWQREADDQPVYILEEATVPDFAGERVVYRGEEMRLTLYGRSHGDYYYRVRVEVDANTSDWSIGLAVRVGGRGGWAVLPPASTPDPNTDLLSVQRALLRMCAARGDLFAVLSLPAAYREDAAMAHVSLLPPSEAPVFRSDAFMLDLPLGYGERIALSYAGMYHPWLIERPAGGDLRQTPPDGAICGMIARRSLARGAWIAPANERLVDVIALTPPIARERWLDLQISQINLVRQEPYGFTTLSTDTLSPDPDLLPINVRRLLHLLRRMVLRLGVGFVFEPNDDGFRRLVRRDVEGILGDLFSRGAFAGPTASSSYQVVLHATPQDIDAGRLIVDVKVAPAQPMTFLTVRLVQTGSTLAVTEER